MKFFTSVAAVGMAVAPAIAQESAQPRASEGTISGTLDLDPAVWNIEAGDGELTSFWAPTDTARRVQIVGLARQNGETDLTDALIIMFDAAGNPTEPEAENPVVAHFPAGSDQTWIAEGENIGLSVEALEVFGESMTVTGSFVGQMTPGGTDSFVAQDAEIITVDGNFQATLRLDEEASSHDLRGD